MGMELSTGDIVHLKKKHPCGSYEWQVVHLGTDIGIRCVKCRHQVFIQRSVLERKIKEQVKKADNHLIP